MDIKPCAVFDCSIHPKKAKPADSIFCRNGFPDYNADAYLPVPHFAVNTDNLTSEKAKKIKIYI